MSTLHTLDHVASPSATHVQPSALRTGAIVLAGSVAANLAILSIARMANAAMVAQPPGSPEMPIGILQIVSALVVSIGLATVLLAVISRGQTPTVRARRWRILATVGLAVGVLSVGSVVLAATTSGTLVALSLMHIVPAVLWFVVLRRETARVEH